MSFLLCSNTSRIPLDSLVHVSELVEWTVEYRCFVMDREIVTISPYRRHGEEIRDHSGLPAVPRSEQDAAEEFASSVVKTSVVACPPAFVLDVGFINQRGWAVIEVNESWASGIYACDPARVLDVLLSACVAAITKNEDVLRWDFKQFYSAACPSY